VTREPTEAELWEELRAYEAREIVDALLEPRIGASYRKVRRYPRVRECRASEAFFGRFWLPLAGRNRTRRAAFRRARKLRNDRRDGLTYGVRREGDLWAVAVFRGKRRGASARMDPKPFQGAP